MFSVLIITHNRPIELLRAVTSVANQTLLPHEIIIVDDASAPKVVATDFQFISSNINLKVVRHENSRGPSVSRNVGINVACSEWIVFLDDDDEFAPNKLNTLKSSILLDKDFDLIYHPALIIMDNEKLSYLSRPQELPTGPASFRFLLIKNCIGGTSMVAARRSMLLKVGGFNEKLRAFEDYELWLRMCKEGCKFHLIRKALTHYHHATVKPSITKSDDAGLLSFDYIMNLYYSDYSKLTISERRENLLWQINTVTHREILKLRYLGTINSIFYTIFTLAKFSYIPLLIASLFGPKFLIFLKVISSKLKEINWKK
jgi:glycosyltransferase involved in cell wall biosynthesis